MSQRLDYQAAAPAILRGLDAVYAQLRDGLLPRRLIDLAFLRTSQINGCAYCIHLHTSDLRAAGLPLGTLMLVAVWREALPQFDAREQAALAWAETVTNVAQTQVPQAAFDAAQAAFSTAELAELTAAIALMNAYNRLAISFRRPPPPPRA